jgi:hypothetical protein
MKLNIVKTVSIAGLLFLSACGGGSNTDTPIISIDTPIISTIDQQFILDQDGTLSFQIDATDPSGLELFYDLVSVTKGGVVQNINGITLNTTNNVVTVTWDTTVPVTTGDYDVEILVTNSAGATNTIHVTVTVRAKLVIGDTGPGGGIVFYITDGGIHGLEAAPVDQSTGATWGCRDDGVITGADGTAIGTGAQNTADIIVGCAEAGIAAIVADEVIINNYGDWYLPSTGELTLMNDVIGLGSSTLGNVGNFVQDSYWSSTENGFTDVSAKVYFFHPTAAGMVDMDKATPNYVRVIRTF